MSILHSSRAPWILLILFCIVAGTFFVLAAGRDVGLLPEAVSDRERPTVWGELRRAITWGEHAVVDTEKAMVHKAGETLEHAGQKLEGWAGASMHEDAAPTTAPPPRPAKDLPAPKTPRHDSPGKLLSHDFAFDEDGFMAAFTTNRPVPQPRVFFIADPARWVVDVPGTWKNSARFNNSIAEGFISRVVLGEHDNYLRLVFHFRDITRSQPDQPPLITREDQGLVVLIAGQ
jgi:hypothetical protein